MFVYDLARKINQKRKQSQKNNAGRFLSPVRRIEKVAPLTKGRYVAMTFDDGPSALPPSPSPQKHYEHSGLTDILLDILKKYDAKGTFDVIGTTEYNYPDKPGKLNSFSWGGMKFDHYPDFQKDTLAGVKNQLDIARRMILEGHELSNHGYCHILYGPMKLVYGRRKYFKTIREVVDDLSMLHDYIFAELNYELKLARPPHYIDKIPDGHSSYNAYKYMGYQYLAASFDGGGWKPSSSSYENDVAAMVNPIEDALSRDPNILNGQIIFQKDGCNMSRETPVADALDRHLKLLTQAGYKVVTVSELLKLSPFEDMDETDSAFEAARQLANAGHCVGYKNNTFQPDRVLTKGELAAMLIPPAVLRNIHQDLNSNSVQKDQYNAYISLLLKLPWFTKVWKNRSEFIFDTPVTDLEFGSLLDSISGGIDIEWKPQISEKVYKSSVEQNSLLRRDIVDVLAALTNRDAYNKLYM
jgi:peptidoglycan/xylan/chitin deacetylase (PgdA/CDA1 family)